MQQLVLLSTEKPANYICKALCRKSNNSSNKNNYWEAERTSATSTTICCVKLIEPLVFLERLSNVFGGMFPGNFIGNSFLEYVLNQSVLQPLRSPVASVEAVTSVDVNAIVMPRSTLPPRSGLRSMDLL